MYEIFSGYANAHGCFCVSLVCEISTDFGPLTINLNIDAKTNGTAVDNILSKSLYFIFNNKLLITKNH